MSRFMWSSKRTNQGDQGHHLHPGILCRSLRSGRCCFLGSYLAASSDSWWRFEVLKPTETRGVPRYAHINRNKESSCSNGDGHEIGVPFLIVHNGLATSSGKKSKGYGFDRRAFETAAPCLPEQSWGPRWYHHQVQKPSTMAMECLIKFLLSLKILFFSWCGTEKHISDSLKELNSIC